VRSGAERQFHCHVQVPGSSWEVDEDVVAGADTAGEGCALLVDEDEALATGEEGLVAAVAAAEAAAATFTCVTGPLSPALPMRTVTLTLLGAL
jgi:hypothetical protein